MVTLAQAAEQSLLNLALTEPVRLGDHTSARPSLLGHKMAVKLSSLQKRRLSFSHDSRKFMVSVVRSENAIDGERAESRRALCGWERSDFSAEKLPTVKRTQARSKKLKHDGFSDSILRGFRLCQESSWCLGTLVVSGLVKNKLQPPFALGDDYFQSGKFILAASSGSRTTRKKRQASLLLLVVNTRFWRELA